MEDVMSTPVNPSSIMIYKIIKDYEKSGRTIHLFAELDYFSNRVLELANSISNEDFWIAEAPELTDELSRICDLTSSFCELNECKYNNGGKEFAKRKIGQMPYSWLKAALATLKEYDEESNKIPANPSVSTIHYPNGEKQTSAIFWDRGQIVIEDEEILGK